MCVSLLPERVDKQCVTSIYIVHILIHIRFILFIHKHCISRVTMVLYAVYYSWSLPVGVFFIPKTEILKSVTSAEAVAECAEIDSKDEPDSGFLLLLFISKTGCLEDLVHDRIHLVVVAYIVSSLSVRRRRRNNNNKIITL